MDNKNCTFLTTHPIYSFMYRFQQHITENLSWQARIRSLCHSLSKTYYFIKSLKNILSNIRFRIFTSPVFSHDWDMVLYFGEEQEKAQEVGPKKTEFSLKKKIYLHFEQKTLNPLQNNINWRQYTCPIFFPTVWSISGTAEAWCCWVPPAKLFTPPPRWQISFLSMFFSLSGIKRNHRGLGPVNRVGGEWRSIPEKPNTGSQTKLCEMGRCHDGETNHPISTITGCFLRTFSLNHLKTSK